jgi:glucose-1-phosphate cytidylyltransferase
VHQNDVLMLGLGLTTPWQLLDPHLDIDALLDFHRSHGKMATVSAVRPVARFGELDIVDERVSSLEEKPQLHQGWISGGYFVVQSDFFDLIMVVTP